MRRLWRLLRPEAAALAAACVCMLALALTTAVAVALVGPVLRALLLGTPADLGVLGRLVPAGLLSAHGFPVLIIALALVKGLAYFGQFQLLARIGQRTSSRLRRTLLSHLLSAPPAVLGRHQTGELLTRFQNDATAVEMAVTYALGAYVRDGATALLLLALCLLLDWRLSLLACAALPLTLVPLARLLKRLRRRVKAASVSQGALGHLVAQGLQGLPSIQVDGLESQEATRFAAVSSEAVEHQLGSARVRAILSPLMELAAAVGICGMLIVAADSVASGTLDGEKLTSFLASALLLVQPLKALGKVGHFAVAGQVSLARIDELLLETAPETARPTSALGPLRREIVFRDVSYAYSPGATPALDRLNLSLHRGERLALVGPSGAGKSTLFQLLLGLRAPDHGEILYDGQPLTASSDGLGGQLAWVGQEPFLFDGTVAENIALGQESPDPERLKLAARRSQSLDFIERMGGFQAEVGERGRKLSGGERQRLSIARALYQDAPLLLLDEPTSHLDPENERALRQALDELVKDRTVLLIAHRLTTVRSCERAVVLERGRAVEEGRPEDLLSAAGRFSTLFAEDLRRDRVARRSLG